MSRYNLNARQPDSGSILTVDCQIVEKPGEIFIVMKYLSPNGKVIRMETETVRK